MLALSLIVPVSTPSLAGAQAPPQPPAQPASALAVSGRTPEAGKLIVERRPVIAVTLGDPGAVDPKSIVMEVDATDVTLFVKVEAGKVTYVPASDLKHGEHTVKLTASDKSGAAVQPVEWKFKIRRFPFLEEASLEGDLTGSYERAIRKAKKEPKDDSGVSKKTETPLNLFSGNLHVNGLVKEEELTAKLDSNIRYVDEFRPRARPKSDAEKLDIANYLISVNRNPLTFEMGDVLINEGFFGAPSLSRRGMHLQAKGLEQVGAQLHLFGTRYESTQGHDPFFGPEESDSVLYGGALTVAPFQDRELLKLHALNAKGHRFSTAPGSNVGTIVSGEEGELVSFGTSSGFFGGKVKLQTEIAFSEFDTDTTNEFKEESDKAYRGRLEMGHDVAMLLDSPVMVRFGSEYSYVGFRFRSPANPGVQPDREGYSLKTDTIWKIATLSLGYSKFNDNTDRLDLLPRVRTYAWNTGLTLAPQNLPSLGLNYAFADQRSYYEPEEFGPKRIDNFQHTYGFTTAYGREAWNVNLGGSVNYFQDETLTVQAGDKVTWTAQTGLTLKPFTSTSISPSFNFNLIDDQDKQVFLRDNTRVQRRVYGETLTGTVNLTQEFIPKVLNLDISVSGASTQSSDDTVDNQTYGGVGRLSWNVGKLFSDWGRQAVSLRMNFNRVKDHITPQDKNEIGVFVILDLLAPFGL